MAEPAEKVLVALEGAADSPLPMLPTLLLGLVPTTRLLRRWPPAAPCRPRPPWPPPVEWSKREADR